MKPEIHVDPGVPTADALERHGERLYELCLPNRPGPADGLVFTSAMRIWMQRAKWFAAASITSTSFLAWDADSGLIGHAMTVCRAGTTHIFGVFVDPAARRRGAGSALYRAAHAHHDGAIYVSPPDDAARAFYRSLGVRW